MVDRIRQMDDLFASLEKPRPMGQPMAERRTLAADFIADIVQQPNIVKKFGKGIVIYPEAVVYRHATLEQSLGLVALLNGSMEADQQIHDVDMINGFLSGENDSRHVFTAFSSSSLDMPELSSYSERAISITNNYLGVLQSPFKI